ncbi:MAG TPA: porin family protein [Longimicrobiales bacterium]|nr:porin family protein [Longimicrobiales bacterium]
MTRVRATMRLGVLAALTAVGAAAGDAAGQSAMGVKAGANLATLAGADDSGSLTGLTAGAYLGFGIGDRLAVQLEALYSVRGGTGLTIGANALDPAAAPSDVQLSYVEVPLLLRAGYPGERLLASLFLGPYVGFLLSCRLTQPDGAEGDCDDEARASWFSPRGTEYGLVVGGGLDWAIGESTIFVDLRYALGLTPIQAGDDAMDLRNQGLTIAGGFAIPLGR